MASHVVLIGIFVIVVGIILVIVGSLVNAQENKTDIAIGSFIMPIPFGFATNPAIFLIILAITVIAAIAFILLNWKII